MLSKEKRKQLQSIMDGFNKQSQKDYGEVTAGFLGEMPQQLVQFLPTGSLVLDSIMGGGLAKGRIIEFYGSESSGKTSMAILAMANVQKNGGTVAFLDVEKAFDPKYAKVIGLNINDLVYLKPTTAKEVFSQAQELVESGLIDLIVVDSVSVMISNADFDKKDPTHTQMGALAKAMSSGLPKLTAACERNNCTVIFINQTRSKIGVVYGNPETTSGGSALRFCASQRVRINRVGVIQDEVDGEKIPIGTSVKLEVVKNKVARPFGKGETVLSFAEGIDKAGEVFVLGAKYRIIKKSGNSYLLNIKLTKKEEEALGKYKTKDGDIRLAIGVDNAKAALKEDEKLYKIVSKYVIARLMELQDQMVDDKNAIALEDED